MVYYLVAVFEELWPTRFGDFERHDDRLETWERKWMEWRNLPDSKRVQSALQSYCFTTHMAKKKAPPQPDGSVLLTVFNPYGMANNGSLLEDRGNVPDREARLKVSTKLYAPQFGAIPSDHGNSQAYT